MNESNERYSWDPKKRETNIGNNRKIDIVEVADLIFADPNIRIRSDSRKNYGEERYLAYAIVDKERFCLCFTPRENKLHLITVFRQHNNKKWRENYESI